MDTNAILTIMGMAFGITMAFIAGSLVFTGYMFTYLKRDIDKLDTKLDRLSDLIITDQSRQIVNPILKNN